MPGKAKIIIVNGQPASGKDTLADKLSGFGFEKYGVSDELRRIALERGLDPSSHSTLNQINSELQTEEGRDWFVKRIASRIEESPESKIVLTSIRHPVVMSELIRLAHDKPHKVELATIALLGSPEVRFDNARQDSERNRGNNLEEFIAQEQPEQHARDNKAGLATLVTMRMCDISFEQKASGDYSYQDNALNWLRQRGMI